MRSLTELQAQASALGIEIEGQRREDLMDAIRDALGGFDPALQIDPMKAKDSKRDVEALGLTAALAKLTKSGTWVMEPKLDGARMRLFLGSEYNTMNTGRRSVKTFAYLQREDNFPHLRDVVVPELAGTVLDGEIMMPGEDEHMLNATTSVVNSLPETAAKLQAEHGMARFFAFDVLAHQGRDITAFPLWYRREYLVAVNRQLASAYVSRVEQVPAKEAYIAECLAVGYEGVMLKRCDGRYHPGKRSADWIKIKPMSTFDCFVTGSIPGEGRNAGLVGALKMSLMTPEGPLEVAQHGAFTDQFRRDITDPVTGAVRSGVLGTVMELRAQGVTKGLRVRHPHLVRLRPDKIAEECDLAQLDALPRC